jgi:hypothetical protein
MKKIGFIDYFLDEWHANQYPAWIERETGGEMEVAYAFGKIDAPNGLDNTSWCREKGIERLDSIDAVVEKSDYLIVLSPDNPEFHQELATIPLKSGKPTYVDKTFAPDRRTAEFLFNIAITHNTPLLSSSALRFAPEYAELDKSGVESIFSVGPGRYDNYSIHQIEPIVSLMGTEVEKVMSLGSDKSPILMIGFSNGRTASLHHVDDSPFSLFVNYGSKGSRLVQAESNFFVEFTKRMVRFFETGKTPVVPDETIAIITIIEYGYKALQTPYKWIKTP